MNKYEIVDLIHKERNEFQCSINPLYILLKKNGCRKEITKDFHDAFLILAEENGACLNEPTEFDSILRILFIILEYITKRHEDPTYTFKLIDYVIRRKDYIFTYRDIGGIRRFYSGIYQPHHARTFIPKVADELIERKGESKSKEILVPILVKKFFFDASLSAIEIVNICMRSASDATNFDAEEQLLDCLCDGFDKLLLQ